MSENPTITAEDADLEHVRALRREVESSLRTESGKLPDDPRMLSLYLHNLDAIERTALSRKKIEVDKKISQSNAAMADAFAQLLLDPRASQFGRTGVREDTPVLDESLAPTRLIEGELTQSNSGDNYEAFAARTKALSYDS